jgi:hypothetical protein
MKRVCSHSPHKTATLRWYNRKYINGATRNVEREGVLEDLATVLCKEGQPNPLVTS